jgi:hypothetical protein
MDRISDVERQRIAELLAEGAPVWRLHKEINRSRHAIRRAVIALHRPARREPGAVTAEAVAGGAGRDLPGPGGWRVHPAIGGCA